MKFINYNKIRHPSHNKIIITLLLSSLIFLFLWYLTATEALWLIKIDQYVNLIVPNLHNAILTPIMYYISEVFEPKLFVLWFTPLLLLLIYRGRWWRAGFLFIGVGIGQVIKTIVKHLTDKPRPENPFGILDTATSFPSGHAVAAVFIFLEVYILVTPLIKKSWQLPVHIVLILLMFAVPLSRVYLQVHYVSDIVAGSALGVASIMITLLLFHHFIPKNKQND